MLAKSRVLLSLMLLLASCSGKPELEKLTGGYGGSGGSAGPQSGLKTIAYVKSLYQGAPRTIDDQIYLEGWIVANDRYGNYYKTIVIQDETGGIEVKIEMDDIYLDYWVNSKVKVNCNSLTIGAYGGSLQLGTAYPESQYETGYIPNNRINSVLSEIVGAADVVPVELSLPQICAPETDVARYVNCYVSISGVQFTYGGQGVTWSDSQSDTNRDLVDINGNKIIVRTSCNAEFAGYLLPAGSGTIKGILGYFNGQYQLKVCDPRSVFMDDDRF